MCVLGAETGRRLEIPKNESIVGYREWIIRKTFGNNEKFLESLTADYKWPKNIDTKGNVEDNMMGIYSYNNYNYNYNYYDYNYYDYNYKVLGYCNIWGKIVEHKIGYRSEFGYPKNLVLDDRKWLKGKAKKLAHHFNEIVEDLAKEYKIKTIGFSEFARQNNEI